LVWRGRRRQALFGAVTAAMGSRADRAASLASASARPATTGAAPAAMPAGEDAAEIIPLEIKTKFPAKEMLKERVLAAAREHPEEIAQVLRAWIVKRRVAT